MKPGKSGVARIRAALRYSWHGLGAAFRHEAAFRQELVIAIVLMPLAVLLPDTATESALLLGSLGLVLIEEPLNSGLEAAVDRNGPEYHPLEGRAKDMASAAVLVALLTAGGTWLCIHWPYFRAVLFR